ncbi:MAG: hypothetical protein NZ845_01310 [Thermodesulfovibrio sp.]|nr:hypothetical protein [Thermodesulfovibrio sp.]
MTKILLSLILIIFILSLSIYASSSQETKKEQILVKKTILDFKKELNLSDSQIKEIEKLLQEFKTKKEDTVKSIRQHDLKLKQLYLHLG